MAIPESSPRRGRAPAAGGGRNPAVVARAVLRLCSPRRLAATAAFVGDLARRIRRRRAEPRLTVAVDVDALYETLTGVGWYLHELLVHLAQRDDLRLRLYGQRLAPAGEPAPPLPEAELAADDLDATIGGPAPPPPTSTATAAPLPAGAFQTGEPPVAPAEPLATRTDGSPRLPWPAVPPLAPSAPPPPPAQAPPAPRSSSGPVVRLPAGPAIEHVTYAAPDGLVIPPWRADQLLRRLAPLLMAADRNRVLFGPNFLLPPLFRFARGARVATIHDLSWQRVPWAVRPDTARALAERLERTLLDADLLLTDSQAVAGELAAAGVSPARVRAIHLGPGHLPRSPVALAAAAPPAGTPHRYGLFVGTLEPRKNVTTLLAAWRELHRAGGAPPLLLCGPFGWRAGELRRQLAAAASEGWLRYLGYVSPSELAALYRGAAVVALPSLYEGFGIPVVEALAVGAPLVLSDLPVFREVAGDAALYAPAMRPDLWHGQLRRVLDDGALRQALSRRARERSARFDWQRTAAATAAAWREAAGAG